MKYFETLRFVTECFTLQEFPLRSTLDPQQYGPQESAIKPEHIEFLLEGLKVAEVKYSFRCEEMYRWIR